MNMEIRIKSVRYNDLESILKMQKLAFQYEAEIYKRVDLPALTQELISLQNDFKNYRYFKAVIGNALVGAVRIKMMENSGIIERLMVLPNFQKMGIGAKLMDFAESSLQDKKRIELITGKKSLRNIKFYEKRGYVIKESITLEIGLDLVKMEKHL